jgi:hypothetical protein
MCPAVLLANTNTPAGVNAGVNSPNSRIQGYDSGNITVQNVGGKPATRATYGLQNQATQAMQSDSTSGVTGNFIPTTVSNTGSTVTANVPATITNITITDSGNVSTCTFAAVNTFVAGQSVKFSGLTTVPALNYLEGVVLSAGLSGTQFECTLVQAKVPAQTSASETGTATVMYTGRAACLSLGGSTT